MTIINQNSISGITSITAASGSVQIFNSDGSSGSLTDLSGVNVVGVVTATSFVGDGSNLTGIDATQIVTGNTSVQTVDTGSDGHIKFNTEGSEVARFDSSGRFGVGTASPGSNLHVEASATSSASIVAGDTTSNSNLQFGDQDQINVGLISYNHTDNVLWFRTNGSGEDMRIDSSGRLLVGTTSAPTTPNGSLQFAVESPTTFTTSVFVSNANSVNGAYIALQHGRGGTADSDTIVQSGDDLGGIQFVGADGTTTRREAATIKGQVDGNPGSGDMPGRLVFYTTADGASSPTERMRIDSQGRMGLGTASPLNTLHILQNGDGLSDGIGIQAESGDARRLYVGVDHSAGAGVINTDTHNLHLKAGGSRDIQIYTNGSERARFNRDGQVLVGTTSSNTVASGSAALVQVATDVSSIHQSWTDYSTGNNSPRVVFGKSVSGTKGSAGSALTNNYELGNIRFAGSNGTSLNTQGVAISVKCDADWNSNSNPGRIEIATTPVNSTVPTERMRINRSGAIGGFTDASSDQFVASHAASAGTSVTFFTGRHSASAIFGGTGSFNVFTNGNVQNTNNSYTGISDIKLKENIVDASSQWDDLKSLRVVNYNFKEETGQQTHTQLGVVAQEVELVSPGLVFETPDRDEEGNDLGTTTKSVNYSVLYMKAVKALQEAMERIETLETANASQATTIAALDARLTALEGG